MKILQIIPLALRILMSGLFVLFLSKICFAETEPTSSLENINKKASKKRTRSSALAKPVLPLSDQATEEINKIHSLKNKKMTNTAPSSRFSKSPKAGAVKTQLSSPSSSTTATTPSSKMQAPISSEPTSIFKVEDPELIVLQRPWKYVFGLKIQSIKPYGKVSSSLVGDFNLNSYPTSLFSSAEFGVGKKISRWAPWDDWKALAQVGYSSARVPLVFKSGYQALEDTQINTLKVNLGIEAQRSMDATLQFNKPLFYKVGLSIGKMIYTQTSLNDLGQFSESLFYGGINLGANYFLYDNITFSGDYIFRAPLQASLLGVQQHNFELGLNVIW